MVLSFLVSLFFEFGPFDSLLAWQKLVLSVAVTTVGWVTVTFITTPTEAGVLRQFHRSLAMQPGEIRQGAYAALLSTLGIYGALFAGGAVLLGNYAVAAGLVLMTVAAIYLARYWFNRASDLHAGAAIAAK